MAPMSEVVDAYTHVLPHEFFEALLEVHPNQQLRTLGESPHLWDVEKRLADMDARGVDRQVLTLVRPPIWRGLDPDVARGLAETANDGVAAIADDHPDRFLPVATVPHPTADAVSELERCVDELDVVGVQLFSNVDGRPLDDDAFLPFYERAAELGAPVWIHPQLHEWHDWISEYDVNKVLGWPFDTSVALLRLVMGGVLEAVPDLRVVAHHVGGMIPFFAGRIETVYEARRQYPEAYPMEWADLSRPIPSYFEQVYADTVIGGNASALRCGYDFFGPDRLVLGSDYPMGPDEGEVFIDQALDAVDALDIDEAARDRVRGGNLAELLGR